MSANGYEIRLGLLSMAKDMLFERWHIAIDAARHNAQLSNAPLTPVEAPAFAEIEDLANKLYGFVQTKGDGAPRQLRNPTLLVPSEPEFFGNED